MLILSVFLITCFGIVISFYKYKKVREIEGLIHHYSKMESNIAKECKTGNLECLLTMLFLLYVVVVVVVVVFNVDLNHLVRWYSNSFKR